jgi:uncharacterized damage-inducible protein DinB
MLSIGILSDLFRHMEWADAATWSAVLASDAAKTDAKLRDRLYHMHVTQRSFLRMWSGEAREAPYPAFDDAWPLMRWAREYYPDALAALANLGDDGLSGPLPHPRLGMIGRRIGRPPHDVTIGESAMQVVLHSNHHRGQINEFLHEAGGVAPIVDYIAWVWLGKPEAGWPAEPPRNTSG